MTEPLTTQQLDNIRAVADAAAQLGADIDPATVTVLLADNQHLRTQLAHAEAAIKLVQAAIEPYDWEHAQVPARKIRAALAVEPAAARPAATNQDSQP